MPTTHRPWLAVTVVLAVVLAVLAGVMWWRPTPTTTSTASTSLGPSGSPGQARPSGTPTPIDLGTPTPTRRLPPKINWPVLPPAETLPKLFNGLPIDQFNHPETLGNLPLNPQESLITVYSGTGTYGGSGTYDKRFNLKVIRGLSLHEFYIMAVKSMVDPQHYGRLTCGHGKIDPKDFECVAYGEDAFILGESGVPIQLSEEEIIAMTNEYLDHALNARNP